MKMIGGPYDGMEIDHNDINLYTTFVPMLPRKFVLMPPFADWQAVKREEIDKETGPFSGSLLPYEIFHDGNGAELCLAPAGEFERAITGQRNPPAPVLQIAFTGRYFQCCRGIEDLPADYFDLTDEKDRVWKCVEITRKEGEGRGRKIPQTAREIPGQRVTLTTMWVQQQSDLRMELSDIID